MAEPRVRFKRDDGSSYPAWKEVPLGTLITDNLDPVPTPKEGYRRVGIYCHAKGTFQEDVSAENVLDVDTMYRIHKDNLIVNITFAWEHAVAIVKPEDEGLLVSHRFPEYSFNEDQVPGFYKYLVLRPYFRNQLSIASPGGAGRNRVLNKAQFKKIPVSVPCEEEQQKIADFLSSVDEVISTSEEEVANLETQKKAVMKKIFSQEVRFKRPDGSDFPNWEESSLGKLEGKASSGKDKNEVGDVPLYGSMGPIGTCSQATHHGNKILVARVGANAGAAKLVTEDCGVTDNTLIIKDTKSCNFVWLYYVLVEKDIGKMRFGGGQPLVTGSMLFNLEVLVPHPDEQRFIADFLSDFDEAIVAAKRELELWKELKKGLLQQMFV